MENARLLQTGGRMSRSAARWLLWLVLLITLPVPFFMGAQGLVPPIRVLFLAGIAAGMLLTEGAQGTAGMFAGLGVAQALIVVLLTLGLAALLARLIHRWLPQRLRTPVVILIAVSLLGVSLMPIYDTPLSSSRMRSSVLQAFR
jgi:hypothetical protein